MHGWMDGEQVDEPQSTQRERVKRKLHKDAEAKKEQSGRRRVHSEGEYY